VLSSGRRVVVLTEHRDPLRREILFEGYPPVQSSRGTGGRQGGRAVRI